MTRLSVSASRVLMGLGVIGITSAFGADTGTTETGTTITVEDQNIDKDKLLEFLTPGNKITFTGTGIYDAKNGLLLKGKEEGKGKNKKVTVAELTVQGKGPSNKGAFKIGTTSGNLEFGGHSHLTFKDINLTMSNGTGMDDGAGILFSGTNNTLTLQNTVLTPQMAQDTGYNSYMFGSATGGDLTIELGDKGYLSGTAINVDGLNDSLKDEVGTNLIIKGLLAGGNKLNENNRIDSINISLAGMGPSSLTLDNIGGNNPLIIGELYVGNGSYDGGSGKDSFRVINGSNITLETIDFAGEDRAEIYIEKSNVNYTESGSIAFGDGVGLGTVIAIKEGSKFLMKKATDITIGNSYGAGDLTLDLAADEFKKGSKEGILDISNVTKIKIGDTKGAKLKLVGAHNIDKNDEYDKTNANIKHADGFTIEMGINKDGARYSELILDNSFIKAKLNLIENTDLASTSPSISANAFRLSNGSVFVVDKTSNDILVNEQNTLTIELKQGSRFHSTKNISVGTEKTGKNSKRADLSIIGNNEDTNYFILSDNAENKGNNASFTPGKLKLTLGDNIQHSGGEFNVTLATALIDGLVLNEAGTWTNPQEINTNKTNAINLTTANVIVTGKTAFHSKTKDSNIITLENGKIAFNGGFESGKSLAKNESEVTFNFKNFNFAGYSNVSKILIGGNEKKVNVGGAKYNLHFASYRDLVADNKTLVQLIGKDATFDEAGLGTIGDIKFRASIIDAIPEYHNADFVTMTKDNSEVYKTEFSSAKLEVVDGNKLNFVLVPKTNVKIEDRLYAKAYDNQFVAKTLLTLEKDKGALGDNKDITVWETHLKGQEEAVKIHQAIIKDGMYNGEKYDEAAREESKLLLVEAQKEVERYKKIKEKLEAIKAKNPDKNKDIGYYMREMGLAGKADWEVVTKAFDILGNKLNNSDLAARIMNGDLKKGVTSENGIEKLGLALANTKYKDTAWSVLEAIGSNLHASDRDKIATLVTSKHFFNDTIQGALDVNQLSDSSSSPATAVNVANDMSIGNRMARFNNPYLQNDAKRFASLGSDVLGDYYDKYDISLWANAFGGMTLIDGNNGGVYGVTGGVDSNLNDELLLGAYVTYSNATLKTDVLEQQADNFMLGAYTQYKFAPTWEFNARVSGQVGLAKQDRIVKGAESYKSDFTRSFMSVNANVGKVFNLGKMPLEDIQGNLYIKPFVGANFYYSYTPAYKESGFGQSVNAQSNNSLSLEAGAEFRLYIDEISYIFMTPKFEQYVVNSGDDYTAKFARGMVSFTLDGEEKKKSYGQIVIGGNYDVSEELSVNAGVGVKQILSGKVNGVDETYLTGNLGAKYKF